MYTLSSSVEQIQPQIVPKCNTLSEEKAYGVYVSFNHLLFLGEGGNVKNEQESKQNIP